MMERSYFHRSIQLRSRTLIERIHSRTVTVDPVSGVEWFDLSNEYWEIRYNVTKRQFRRLRGRLKGQR